MTMPIGTIVAYALITKNLPDRWLLCDGSPIPPGDYQELSTLLGSANTPNLAGRTLIGTGVPTTGQQSDGLTPNFPSGEELTLNYTGGEFSHVLSASEMPTHQHQLLYQFSLSGGCPGGSGSTPCLDGSQSNMTTFVGEGAAHNNMQPYQAVNFIIYGGPASSRHHHQRSATVSSDRFEE